MNSQEETHDIKTLKHTDILTTILTQICDVSKTGKCSGVSPSINAIILLIGQTLPCMPIKIMKSQIRKLFSTFPCITEIQL